MSQSKPDAPHSGPAIPSWAWFLVASLIAVSLIGILVVLLLKDPAPSATVQVSEGAVLQSEPIVEAVENLGPDAPAVASSVDSAPGVQSDEVVESDSMPELQDAVADSGMDGESERAGEAASADRAFSAADIVNTSSKGVVLISTFNSEDQKVGVGSGFLVHASGLVATNFHVLRGSSRAEVEFRSGESIPVRGIRAYDEYADLAVLEIESTPEESSVLQLADHAERPNASAVISVGHPEQFKFTTTTGILSAVHSTAELPLPLRQRISAPPDNLWLQTTAVIAGGSSGGPLFNDRGEVIGINTWHSPSFSFASDVRHLQEVLEKVSEKIEPIDEVTGPDQEFQQIVADYQNKLRYFNQESSEANTPELQEAVIARDPTPDYAARFLKLAEEHPDTPINFSCLKYVCQLSLQALEPERCESQLAGASDLLVEHYCNDSRLSRMLWGLRGQSSEVVKDFLEKLVSESEVHDIKGLSLFALGVNFYSSGIEDDAQQAIDTLERVRSEFSDVVYLCSDPRHPEHNLGTEAEHYLYELKTLWIGRMAPTITGKDQHDETFSLDELKGKIVVLDFWAAWCSPCIRSLPHQKELVEAYADEPVEVIGVFCDVPDKLMPLIESEQVTWRNWMDGPDGGIGDTYRIGAYPTIYVIDQQGRIHFRQEGVVDPGELHQVIDGLLGRSEE